jgi:uncharacterized cupredoxin-like copper-binding protein
VKRILLASIIVLALVVVAVSYASTTLTDPVAKSGLAYAKKRLVAKHGKITLKMPNPSLLRHNIALRKGTGETGKLIAKGKIVGKGGVSKITVTLKPGKYRFFCTVPGHEDAGMWGILTVK